jgi:hypothetical protein
MVLDQNNCKNILRVSLWPYKRGFTVYLIFFIKYISRVCLSQNICVDYCRELYITYNIHFYEK